MYLRVCAVTWGEGTLPGALAVVLLATSLNPLAQARAAEPALPSVARPFTHRFDIPASTLADALDLFGEQSGLQIVYPHALMQGKAAPRIQGSMAPAEALDKLLASSGVRWHYINSKTIAIKPPHAPAEAPSADLNARGGVTSANGVAVLTDVNVFEDPRRLLPNEASTSTFGFSKPVLETPRSVSFVSRETIELVGLSAVEDLVRVVPGTFTTTRFGIQGSVDIRNVPADYYFRGMKRLTLQGHGRSVLGAMDSIEIVRGPPSPIYGMGKIGGYANVEPTSGRAATGGYLPDARGFGQGIVGAYNRSEWSFGLGGPMGMFGKRGGYYLYGLHEDSDSFTDDVPIKQDVLQAALSIDAFAGPFRLETGANFQVSRTAGALIGRFTQELADSGGYIRGTPLVNLDLNGNGRIGYLEMHRASPVRGALSTANQPLMQQWAWPTDANGRPLPIDQFPRVRGIPQTMYDYLLDHPEADPTGALRAQGVGGPLPASGQVPVGMVLDPRTVAYDTLDLHRAAAFERELRAEFLTGYFDLVHDTNPNFTVRNQLFFDGMQQHKASNQPFAQEQHVYVWEDKLTVTHRLHHAPAWMRINALASANYRETVADGYFFVNGDFATHRSDAMAPSWTDTPGGMTPNTTFANPYDNPNLDTDGHPWNSRYRTRFSELGFGVLFDVDLFQHANLLVGGRIDGSRARNTAFAAFNAVTGTSQNPGALTPEETAKGWDRGASWSVSFSQQLPFGLRPYATLARSSVALDGSNNALSNTLIAAGHIGSAQLREFGLKASLFDRKLFLAISSYEQSRVLGDNDPTELVNAYATSTRTSGWDMELKWVPVEDIFLSCYALNQSTRYDPNDGGALLVDARTLGFQDVRDAQGNVIYPAEAFLYGGRARIVLPAGLSQYQKKQGNPQTQLGVSTHYQLKYGLGLTVSGNYFSSTCSGRLCVVELPHAYVLDAGVFWDSSEWRVKLDVLNALDERWFRARTGDTLGDVLVQAMPDRRWQLTVKRSF